jgi:hypothetical protein
MAKVRQFKPPETKHVKLTCKKMCVVIAVELICVLINIWLQIMCRESVEKQLVWLYESTALLVCSSVVWFHHFPYVLLILLSSTLMYTQLPVGDSIRLLINCFLDLQYSKLLTEDGLVSSTWVTP